MAERYVALLRGINVGKAKRVAMADLRALLADLGHTGVRTLLNSGNVVFRGRRAPAPRVASAIEKQLADRLGVASRVTVLTAPDIELIVKENGLRAAAGNPSRLMVAVLNDAAGRRHVQPLLAERWEPEEFALGTRAAYLWCPDGTIESPLARAVDRALGDAVTTRNWATILKIHAAVSEVIDE